MSFGTWRAVERLVEPRVMDSTSRAPTASSAQRGPAREAGGRGPLTARRRAQRWTRSGRRSRRTLQCADDGQSPIANRGAEYGQWEGPRRRRDPVSGPRPAAERFLAQEAREPKCCARWSTMRDAAPERRAPSAERREPRTENRAPTIDDDDEHRERGGAASWQVREHPRPDSRRRHHRLPRYRTQNRSRSPRPRW